MGFTSAMIPHLLAGFVDCLFTVGSIFTIAWEAGLRLKFWIAEEIFKLIKGALEILFKI